MRRGALGSILFAASLWGQGLAPLRSVPVPKAANLSQYVRDEEALLVLGKALFWDMQLGSDGRTACASCHFHAGADHRRQHQLSNPKGPFPVNHAQGLGDFPFRVFEDAADNRSAVLRDSGQRAGSAGVFRRAYAGTSDNPAEEGIDMSEPVFAASGVNLRQVTPRNTPTIINAVFYVNNLWDGRAKEVFTGATPFGDSDTRANAMAVRDGQLVAERVRIERSSLASQAVGPPLNAVEMSYAGRTWPDIGRKMLLWSRPLALQRVAADDSVLGRYANPEGRGLRPEHTYLTLVQAAFQPAYWDWSGPVTVGAREFSLAEYNFPLFFGLAIQAYESTLVSAETRFDRFLEGDSEALTAQERQGLQLFQGRGECTDCHLGPELTAASFTSVARRGAVTRVRNGLLADTGFFHTGVRPVAEDPGLDDKDEFGNPFSLTASQNPGAQGIAGAFKTPGLRNIEFTGPYFHNGGQASLEEVMEFYNRGGDFPGSPTLSPDVRRLNMSAEERAAVVAFMRALSDDRVRFERAPFDHPELCVPNGHPEPVAAAAEGRFALSASDVWAAVPAVGRTGNAVPLQTFVELLEGIGADGSRAHSMTDPCGIP